MPLLSKGILFYAKLNPKSFFQAVRDIEEKMKLQQMSMKTVMKILAIFLDLCGPSLLPVALMKI